MRAMTKMLRGRKSMLFNVMLVIVAALSLTYAYIEISEKQDKVKKEIGAGPMEVVTQIQEGEKALIFLDFAARMAIYQAVYNLQESGGISKTNNCGAYYDFNRWNSDKGKTCFVDSSTAKDSMRDLFISNLVARVAAYPTADFVGNVPTAAFARGLALSAQQQVAVTPSAVTGTAPAKCTGTGEFQKDFTYESSSGFYPKDGARLWIPAEANCKGSYPLIVWLHGCQKGTSAKSHVRFGDGHKQDVIVLSRKLIKSGEVQPVILAAPSQTKGTATFYGVPNSPCISRGHASLWGKTFDPEKFVKLVEENLPEGIKISSVGFMGHSGAGCYIYGGLHQAAKKFKNAVAIAQFDTCAGSSYGSSFKRNLGADTKYLAIYSNMIRKNLGRRDSQNNALGITKKIECPKTDVPSGSLSECYSDETGKYFGFTMKKINDHALAVSVGNEHFLKMFYPGSSSTTTPSTTATKPATSTTTTQTKTTSG